MIEGLHFDFSTNDLRDLLKERAEYHVKRAAFYEVEATRYGAQEGFDTASNNTTVLGIRDKGVHHRKEAAKLVLLAMRLVPSETYRLDESDLRSIGIV